MSATKKCKPGKKEQKYDLCHRFRKKKTVEKGRFQSTTKNIFFFFFLRSETRETYETRRPEVETAANPFEIEDFKRDPIFGVHA